MSATAISSATSIATIDPTILKRLTENDQTLTKLDLSLKNLDSVAVKTLAEALKANRLLQQLNLGSNILGEEGGKALAEALKVNCTLQQLFLSGAKLGALGVRALSETFYVNCSLRLLSLRLNDLDTEGGIALANSLKMNCSLQVLNLIGNKLGAEAGSALAEALLVNRSLQQLDLSVNKLGAEGGKALAKALKVNSSLRWLNISFNRIRKEWEAFADMLKVNRSLKVLNFGLNSIVQEALQDSSLLGATHLSKLRSVFKNKLNEEGGIFFLAEALKVNCTLHQLDLYDTNLGAEGGKALSEALTVNETLTALDYSNNDIPSHITKAIDAKLAQNKQRAEKRAQEAKEKATKETSVKEQESSSAAPGSSLKGILQRLRNHDATLTELHFTRQKLEVAESRALAEALKVNRFLKVLVLSQDSLGAEGARALAEVLKVNRSLQHLGLRDNILGAEGAEALAGALKVNSSLQSLDLSENDFEEGGRTLADALKMNHSLQKLNLNNDNLGVEGGKAFAEALKVNSSLQELNLSNNHLGAEGGKALAKALKVNRSLQQLDVYNNSLGVKGGWELAEMLESNETLTALDYSNNDIPKEIELAIDAKLTQNKQRAEKREQESKAKATNKTFVSPIFALPSARLAKADVHPLQQTNLSAPPDVPQKREHVSLDAVTAQKLQKLSDKSAEILEAAEKLQVIDAATLQALQGQALQLKRLFDGDTKAEHASIERKRIEADPELATYHRFFARLLTGTWLACQTINSGLVENTEKFTSDRVGQGLDAIGKHIPIISAVTSFFSGAISKWNDRERHQGVQKIAALFPDLDTAFRDLGTLARQATLAQESALKQLPTQATGFIRRVKQRAQDLKVAIFADDVDTPLKRKAVADCQTLLTAIRDGRPRPNPSVADLLTVLMGNGYVYTASPPPSSPPPVLSPTPSQSPQTPSSPSMTIEQMMAKMQQMDERDRQREAEVKRLKERDEARDREFKAWKQRMSPQDNETEVPGDSEAQVQIKITSALNRIDAIHQSPSIFGAFERLESQVTRLTHQVTVGQARQQEIEDTVAVTNARVDRLAKKKSSKT